MINLHYCGQTLESWNLYSDSGCGGDDACGDESEENDDCCKDEVVVVKVNQDQETTSQLSFKISQLAAVPMPAYISYDVHAALLKNTESLTNNPNAPPGLWEGIPLYKLHSNYTYYG